MQSVTLISDLADNTPPSRVTASVATNPAGIAVPSKFANYLALTKPRMNLLVVAMTGAGFYSAPRQWGDWPRLFHTLLGTALTAAGSSVLNQYVERELDGRMVRTHDRPLPAGRVAPTEALALGVILASAGILELRLFVNLLTAALAAITLTTYVFLYTPLKRRSTLCTIVGAVPGALPVVMGWTAVRGSVSIEAVAFFGILFLWQMPHFLAIAILYRDDYASGGFQMLPVVDDSLRATGGQIILYALALIPVSLLPAVFRTAGVVYFTAALALGLTFATFSVQCALTRKRPEAKRLFLASIAYLPLLMAAMMIDKL